MDLAQLTTGLNTFWVVFAGAMVFFMQAGFALVEAGFTRSKNTTNILFKNLMKEFPNVVSFTFENFAALSEGIFG